MRTTACFETLDPSTLDGVTGGCKKPKMPPQQMAMAATAYAPVEQPRQRSAEVTVATGAAGASAIQSAMSGGITT